ncbi:MAG: Uma2 family endonuclease [Leptolyngbyaceae cyanobacterium RM1_1_2]|nr:Uma2 family endonuclease [Leptolyngbyaceae cyanobacterium RM1_1_2]
MLAELVDELAPTGTDRAVCLLVNDVSWQAYEALLMKLADQTSLRVAYLDGVLEVVSPSRRHEGVKKRIATLLEIFFEVAEIEYFPLGSATLRNQGQRGGREPDESYCLGLEKAIPDLAIEVILTSGGLERLAVYARLGVAEVWFWQLGEFSIFCLENEGYRQRDRSQLLSQLDLDVLKSHIDAPSSLTAVKAFREQVKAMLMNSYPKNNC